MILCISPQLERLGMPMKLTFTVTGMTCAACSARVEKVTSAGPGVQKAEVNLLAGTMAVEAAGEAVTEQILEAVEKAGYGAAPSGRAQKEAVPPAPQKKSMKWRIGGSFGFLAVLMYVTMGHMVGLPMPSGFHDPENALVAALLQCFLTLPVVFLNRVYFTRGLKSLWHRSPNMDSLIAVGSGAALVYGVGVLFRMAYAMGHGDWDTVNHYSHQLYFESAAMILTLITLGKYLESKAKGKTGDAIRALMDLRPSTATVERDGEEVTIPAQQIRVGDVIVLRSGSRIPVDGSLIFGRAAVDQSALTGESIPVEKAVADPVSAGTVVAEGYCKFRAEKIGEDTTLSQVIRMVEEAGGSKAPIARLADRVAGVFVPVVMGIALAVFVFWLVWGEGLEFSLTTAVSVLVISCPCALGLATPVAIMVATGKGASLGVLFKNGAALEHLHSIDTVVLDKTGTLTAGKPRVTDILPEMVAENTLLSLAASLEQPSEHPFAAAILERAGDMAYSQVTDFETLPGMGVAGTVEGRRCYGGNRHLMTQLGISVPEYPQLRQQGKTPLYFVRDGVYLGAIAAADVLKEDSCQAVQSLHGQKLQVVMLTGDNEATAQAIAHQAGIDNVIADVLPGDKAEQIKKLQAQGRKVLMVGDGINDAPALVTADVGMAIGAGTDIAMESADVVLMSGSLARIADAILLSKATIRNIRQNLFWAFFYNCLGIPVAAGALFLPFGIQLSPMLGAAAMSFSSVFVVTNALRLRRFHGKKKKKEPIKEEKPVTTVISVNGMMCPHCKAMVEKVCKAVPGTEDAVVDLQAKNVTVTGKADLADLKKAIVDAGYEVVG